MDFLVQNFAVLLFYLLAALTVAGAIGVVALKNPVHAAISLLGTFLMVAALFVLKHAEFLGAVQLLVYAGGILVLFLFVIMLVNVRQLRPESAYLSNLAPAAVAVGTLFGVMIALVMVLTRLAGSGADPAALRTVEGHVLGNTEAVGWVLYRTYLVPFEVVSVILLVAMIGAIVFGRRQASLEREEEGGEQG